MHGEYPFILICTFDKSTTAGRERREGGWREPCKGNEIRRSSWVGVGRRMQQKSTGELAFEAGTKTVS